MLSKAPDTRYLKARYVNADKNIEIGIYPVIYGWRVHAGYINNGWYELDYCAGANVTQIETILTLVKMILEKHDYNFKIFPIQNTKPMYNDPQCFVELLSLAGEIPEVIKVPDLTVLRNEIMSTLYDEKE